MVVAEAICTFSGSIAAPQLPQNLVPSLSSVEHFGQVIIENPAILRVVPGDGSPSISRVTCGGLDSSEVVNLGDAAEGRSVSEPPGTTESLKDVRKRE